MLKKTLKNKASAFTLIDVLIGTFLVSIIFIGIFGAYQLGLKVVSQSKNRIIATAVANGEMEKIRNLPYDSIGIQGGFPEGSLVAENIVNQNSVQYTINRRVDYIVDSADGVAYPEDECPNDYKKVEVKVSWQGRYPGFVKIYTDVTPKNLAQECSTTGGIISVSVFDAYGVMGSSPIIEIKNPNTDDVITFATPSSGKHYFSLPVGTYKIVVSKEGYNTERSYSSTEVTTPEKSHPITIEGRLTEVSFSIDKLSSLSIETLSPWGEDSFSDSFSNSSKIVESSNISVSEGKVSLAAVEGHYQSPGFLISASIIPSSITNWEEVSFTDNEPTDTQIIYKVLYLSGENWVLIPDDDLPNNSTGFGISPINISSLNKTAYPKLRIQGFLSTNDPNFSSELLDWRVSWKTSLPTPIPNVAFKLQGEKIIGHDAQENSVPEYSINHVSDSSGQKVINNLEWDNYTFSVSPSTGLDLVEIDPDPQPINLSPNNSMSVKLYLDSQNSLLATVRNTETSDPIFSASVRLYNAGLEYDVTQNTNDKGQTFFIPLANATYNLEIQAPGYFSENTTVQISGDNTKTINLSQIE